MKWEKYLSDGQSDQECMTFTEGYTHGSIEQKKESRINSLKYAQLSLDNSQKQFNSVEPFQEVMLEQLHR